MSASDRCRIFYFRRLPPALPRSGSLSLFGISNWDKLKWNLFRLVLCAGPTIWLRQQLPCERHRLAARGIRVLNCVACSGCVHSREASSSRVDCCVGAGRIARLGSKPLDQQCKSSHDSEHGADTVVDGIAAAAAVLSDTDSITPTPTYLFSFFRFIHFPLKRGRVFISIKWN